MKRRPRSGVPTKNGAGYMVVTTERGLEYVHRVVWETTYGTIPPGYHVHHRNGVRDDNRIQNLELVNGVRHNRDHTTERHANGSLNTRGDRSSRWRVDLDGDYIVRRHDEDGASFRQIGRELGATHIVISHHYRWHKKNPLFGPDHELPPRR